MLAVTAPTVDTPTTLGFGAIGNTTLNRTLVVLTSALSLLGAIVIIVTYYAWKDMQSTSRKILVYISGADCVVVSSFMFGAFLPPNTNSPACTAQSLLYTTANLCSIFWTTFMAVFLYISIARKKPKLADIMFYMFHAIGWGVPVLIACVALQAGVLGNDRDIYSSAWCWIKVHDSGKNVEDNYIMWMLVTGKAWEVLVFILILIFYGLLKCHLRQEVGDCQWRLSLITYWNTAIRVYFLHLMKLSDCVSRYVKRYHMINSLASHDPWKSWYWNKKFSKMLWASKTCTLTAIFFFYFLHIVQLLLTFVHLLRSSLSGSWLDTHPSSTFDHRCITRSTVSTRTLHVFLWRNAISAHAVTPSYASGLSHLYNIPEGANT